MFARDFKELGVCDLCQTCVRHSQHSARGRRELFGDRMFDDIIILQSRKMLT